MRIYNTKKVKEVEEKVGKPIKEFLTDLYVKKNMTIWDVYYHIKDDLGIEISTSTIHRWLIKYDIPTRFWSFPKVGV